MDKEHKKEIINRLVKDGAIDFTEALELWETEKEIIYVPNYWYNPPPTIFTPWQVPPFIVTNDCGTICEDVAGTTNVVNWNGNELFSYTNKN